MGATSDASEIMLFPPPEARRLPKAGADHSCSYLGHVHLSSPLDSICCDSLTDNNYQHMLIDLKSQSEPEAHRVRYLAPDAATRP